MDSGVFLIQSNGELVEMREQAYDSEGVLQELLAKYPNLLVGDQMDVAAPRRWLLVSREMGVPCEDEGANRWSLDHLFLDQDAIPTLIEVKRSSDTRIRREVVGQMFDYAANAVVYWPIEAIRARFEQGCQQKGAEPVKELENFLFGGNGEEFWQRVKTNLQAGRIRMVFVADVIPPELRRIVEFLNGQMDPAEVLAVEIKQYVGQGLKTLVPRVIGQTVEAERKKGAAGRDEKQWDERSFLDLLSQRYGPAEAEVAQDILDWAKKNNLRLWWGKGAKDGSFFPMIDHNGLKNSIISVWTYGRLEIQFQWMKERPPFDAEAKRRELRDRLNRVPGIEIPLDSLTLRPRILLSTLADKTALTQFLAVLDWFVQEVRGS
ncbi:MAG: hypothetical protein K2R98_33110 [Gemmataceae bacterium]|nr:hypothetical protein [Gemmataceae bacterium]